MQFSNKKREIITTMFTAYGQGGDGKRIAVYTVMLDSLPDDVLKLACKKVMLENNFMPTVSDIVAAAKSLATPRIKDFDEVWAEVMDNIHHSGYYGKLIWSTPEIEKAVKNIGWRNICCAPEGDAAIRAQLRDMYKSVCKRKSDKENNNFLTGRGTLLEQGSNEQLLSGKIKELSERKKF